MRRWHLTLFLAILAAAGVALATTLRVRHRAAEPSGPALVEQVAPLVVPEVLQTVEITPVPELTSPPEVLPPPPPEPPRPPRPPVVPHVDPGVHPIHVDDGELAPNVIPELNEPRPRPVLRQLPPDEPPPIERGCPACGMG